MNIIRIGILTCSNTTRVLDCTLSPCLSDLYQHKGLFGRYKGNKIELGGIISCNGCPTILGAKIIIPKVKSLIHYNIKDIHLSYCMITVCPFIKKYIAIIKKEFPDINLVLGTHEAHQSDETFRCNISKMLIERKRNIIP